MITGLVPEIAEGDYPAFVQICGGRIKPTYGEWIWLQRTTRREGQEQVPVPITPGELIDFCARRSCQADASAIRMLAEEKYGRLSAT
jgi:hypothetical protein